jgi:DNA-binding winged helix-turn-helix (wHTH) protein/Flp pilus assembly protein TadD
MAIYRFRTCLLNTTERIFLSDGRIIGLTTKTFDVLQFLVENHGQVVSKDEILGAVWGGSFVEESNLPVHISKLRRSLGETWESKFIETVQGTGYRFVAPVFKIGTADWRALTGGDLNSLSLNAAFPSYRSSLAVLRFTTKGLTAETEYLADWLFESLLNDFASVPDLKVISRDAVLKYAENYPDLKSIGEILDVAYLLTGCVRHGRNDLELCMELTRANDQAQLWGKTYRGKESELLAVRGEILIETTAKLDVRRTGFGSDFHSPSQNVDAYRLFLKAKYHLEKRSSANLYSAIDLLRKSAAIDPDNIYCYAELVECFRILHLSGRISYERFWKDVGEIVNNIERVAGPRHVKEVIYCDLKTIEWKFEEAAEHCRRALAYNPTSLKALIRYSDVLFQLGESDLALRQLEMMMMLDPSSTVHYVRTARQFYAGGKYEASLAYANDALELEPNNYEALAVRGAAHLQVGEFEKAIRDFRSSLSAEYHPETLAMLGVTYAKQRDLPKARKVVKELKVRRGENETWINLALIYLALNRKELAYKYLERAIALHEPGVRVLNYDPRWQPIRNEKRFQDLMGRVGIPQGRH